MEESEKLVPIFDYAAGEFVADAAGVVQTAKGVDAVPYIVEKAQRTPRGRYLIYKNVDNLALSHKYGSDIFVVLANTDIPEEVRISEIKEAIKEAAIYDPWVISINDIEVTRTEDYYLATYTITTAFNENITVEGVTVSG